MTVARPDEEQPRDEHARAIIRAFWLEEIQGLRERLERERRNQNLPPILNQEIAEQTQIPRSTLSDLLTCKRDVVPDWDRVSLIIERLGGTTKEWVPKWRAARAAYDELRNAPSPGNAELEPDWFAAPAPAEQPESGPESPGRFRWKLLIGVAAAALVVTFGIGAWKLMTEDDSANVHPAAGVSNARCLRVRDETQNVSVFKSPVGDEKWTEWPGATRFWSVGETSHPNRWRVPLDNGEYGYVAKDSHYVVTANDCR